MAIYRTPRYNAMKRIFIDIDGTMSRFYDDARCLELMQMPGFFKTVKPYSNVVEAIKILIENGYDIYVCSSITRGNPRVQWFINWKTNSEADEKHQWLLCHIPLLTEKCIFCPAGTPKWIAVQEYIGRELSKDDILLDDYSAHLRAWRENGGTAIKLVNDINDRGEHSPLWDGSRIRYDWDPYRLAVEILRIGGVE